MLHFPSRLSILHKFLGCEHRLLHIFPISQSLARDIALKAGSRAHLSALRRLRIGPWTLEDSTLSSVDLLKKTGLVSEIKLRDEERKLVENGSIRRRAVISDSDADKPYSFISFSDGLFGIGEKRDGGIRLIARLG